MRHRTVGLRFAWGLFAALQLGLPGLAAWADARLEAASAGAKTHIESHSSPTCVRVHGSDCVLCQYLTGPAAASATVVLAVGWSAAPALLASASLAGRIGPEAGLPQSRAPPTLS